ncbi:zinc ABC transporter substrate-binding protein [Candidatus Saccharibacteria bacterium]|nr:zinc ABC transporter substrate-binding protein [Candidatus Saccharibacteria bacterium]
MKAKKDLAVLALVALVAGCGLTIATIINRNKNEHPKIVVSNFVAYDFAREITGDKDIKMLIKPATETHDFEPSPQDIVDITDADFFIYNGGESERWVENILQDNNISENKTIRMMDFVELKQEDGEDEYDEHIWTNPLNAVRIINAIRDHLIAKNSGKVNEYAENADNYTSRIMQDDQKIRDIVKTAKRKELIFADRFPFRYFVDEYGLDYSAAFPGCSEQTEASSQTITELIEKVKANNIPVILKIELTSDALAKTIASETGAEIRTMNAAHNVSQADFDAGKSYADYLEQNIVVLEEALN